MLEKIPFTIESVGSTNIVRHATGMTGPASPEIVLLYSLLEEMSEIRKLLEQKQADTGEATTPKTTKSSAKTS
jgi:hypothetical protein